MSKLIIITGPSGSGKNSISKYLTDTYHIPRVITHTTRLPRTGERDQQNYYFETPESFSELHLFEETQFNKQRYGSSQEGLLRAWDKNEVASIILENEGAQKYMQTLKCPKILLYVTTPHNRNRMVARGDLLQQITQRLQQSPQDVTLSPELQKQAYVIHNNDWEQTKKQLDQLSYLFT